MVRKLLLLFLTLFFVQGLFAQLVLNEVSQGTTGNREYVEFVVVGTPTCTNNCVDLRNWIIDDNNGFHATGSGTGIAAGCLRFRNIAQWACVPYGSIILIYNELDKNNAITLADDPTDSNNDKVYIIPGNSSVLEGNANYPSVIDGPSYTGFPFSSPGTWSTVLMGNGDDAFHSVNPANLSTSSFALGWGNNTANVDIYFSGSASGKVFYNGNGTNTNPSLQSNWISANVGGTETPGLPNTMANGTWINSLRSQSTTNTPVYTNQFACILNGGSIVLGGQPRTTAGVYNDTLTSVNGCDSIVSTTLKVSTPITVPFAAPPACDSFMYQGMVFKRDTVLNDTLLTSLGCDSVYISATISVKQSKRDTVNVCINSGGSYFAGGANQTASGTYFDTYTAVNGCDSVKTTVLDVISINNTTNTLAGCDSVVFKSITYKTPATVLDTIRNGQGCITQITATNILIKSKSVDTVEVCINTGSSYFAGGAQQTTSGIYQDIFQNIGGCDSVIFTDLTVVNLNVTNQNFDGCDSISVNGKVYFQSIQFADTVRNLAGCITDISNYNITVGNTTYQTVSACINPGGSYVAGGAAQTTSGVYIDTITSSGSCNTYKTTYLTLITPVSDTLPAIEATDSYDLNGVTYYADTVFQTAIPSVQGCDSLFSFQPLNITKSLPFDVFLPTAFSPNGDGVNDILKPIYGRNVMIVEFKIYNRWGELVYNGTSGWDGYFKTHLQPTGVYVYSLQAQEKNTKKTKFLTGNFTLVL